VSTTKKTKWTSGKTSVQQLNWRSMANWCRRQQEGIVTDTLSASEPAVGKRYLGALVPSSLELLLQLMKSKHLVWT
jgi:hypothetical protein